MNPILAFSQLLPPLAWISLSSIFFATGDIMFRYWFQSFWSYGFFLSLLTATLGLFFLTMSFPSQNIAVATVIAILFNLVLYLVAAFILFGDTISIRESVGLLMGFGAIYILEAMK